MVVKKIAQKKKGTGGLLFKPYYPSIPTVHGKKANILQIH
jgi:hypothetical protein